MWEMILCLGTYSIGITLFLSLLTAAASLESVRYRLKFTFFILICAIVPTVCIPLMLLRIRHWKNALISALSVRLGGKFLGVTFRIRGKENIVKDSGCIVLINHQSALDLCGELWPVLERCTVIAKKEIMYFGPFGLATWLWGTIFINRRKGEQAQDTVNSTAQLIKDLKAKLLLFPEGHRHSHASLLPFKKGAFHLAIASQTPIQPVVVSRYYFLNDKLKRFNSGSSCITILPPVSTEGLTKDDLPMLMDKVYESMNKTFVESTEECLNEHIKTLKADE